MKKVIKTLGFIVILALIGLTMLACDGNPKCTHDSWGNWTQVSFGRETRNCNSCTVVEARLTKNIGETGEAGGVIFYRNASGFTLQDINPVNNKTVYYLEVWTANETGFVWGDSGTLVPNVTTFTSVSASAARIIGNGKKDTQIIAAHMTGKLITGTAAQRCASADHGTKTDWFLPSFRELNHLAQIRGLHGIPNIDFFWSSSQYNAGLAWGQNFANGLQFDFTKNHGTNLVRAVRAF